MNVSSPNQIRSHLRWIAKLCDEKTANDPTYVDGTPMFDSANLDRAVANVANWLEQLKETEAKWGREQAGRLRELWNIVSKREDETQSLTALGDETDPAMSSWRNEVEGLRGCARDLEKSPEVGSADGRIFNNNDNGKATTGDSHEIDPEDKVQTATKNSADDDPWLTHLQIAKRFNLEEEATRQKLNRWRKKHLDGWKETSERRRNEPKYLYQLSAVHQLFQSL